MNGLHFLWLSFKPRRLHIDGFSIYKLYYACLSKATKIKFVFIDAEYLEIFMLFF